MANSQAYARIRSDVIAIVRRIPAGRIATHGQIGNHLQVFPRHIAYVLATLDDADCETVPWWRVVADGGAVGRHLRREDQIARLKADGLVVAPVGVVQELGERLMVSLEEQKPGAARVDQPIAPRAPHSRSRGMKGKPTSTV
jgi:methylated-DNA-protein-cysteine methyltransferase related protein